MSLVVGLAIAAVVIVVGAGIVAPELAARRLPPWVSVGRRMGLVLHEEYDPLLRETRRELRGELEGLRVTLKGEEDGNLTLHTAFSPALGPGLHFSWSAGPINVFGDLHEVPVDMLGEALKGARAAAIDAAGAHALLTAAAEVLTADTTAFTGLAFGDGGVRVDLRGEPTEARFGEAARTLARLASGLRSAADSAGTRPWAEVFRARWRASGVAFEGPDASYRTTGSTCDRGTHRARTFTLDLESEHARVQLRIPLARQLPEGWALMPENSFSLIFRESMGPDRVVRLGVPTAAPLSVVMPKDAGGPSLSVLQSVLAACPTGLVGVRPEDNELVFTVEASMAENLVPFLDLAVSLVTAIEARPEPR